jgi:hypothetical protein
MKCRHALIYSCEKFHSHLFVRIGDDKEPCPHCQIDDLLRTLRRIADYPTGTIMGNQHIITAMKNIARGAIRRAKGE